MQQIVRRSHSKNAHFSKTSTDSRPGSRLPTQQSASQQLGQESYFSKVMKQFGYLLSCGNCCSNVQQSTEIVLTRESFNQVNFSGMRGLRTPMQFESKHTEPSIKSGSLTIEEAQAVQLTEKGLFTFRDLQPQSTNSEAPRYSCNEFEDLHPIEEFGEKKAFKATENANSVNRQTGDFLPSG